MSAIQKAIDYGITLVDTPYDYWNNTNTKINAPMFAINGPVVHKSKIVSVNSAGLINLILRFLGKKLPKDSNGIIGGVKSYYEYYTNYSEDFSIETTYPIGTLLIRNFKDNNDQGHLAIIIEEKGKHSKILQSFVSGKNLKSISEGVSISCTIIDIHNLNQEGYFKKAVLPQNWLC